MKASKDLQFYQFHMENIALATKTEGGDSSLYYNVNMLNPHVSLQKDQSKPDYTWK